MVFIILKNKITFTDNELKHSQYYQKLDDCKNTFSKEKTGGKKYKKLKSSQKMI